ncbi:hypothetical protein FK529_06600 [Tsukamurella asaccharolytica]|uniref:Lipoprotein n=1 Tax=Tsukamurella asaccharolytica TaxID=2592067 RepID=A0A5C5R9J6_9ACTN|nr:hypothetical protein [Tsukamurella asaccharolytica]TWS19817.1 hypothetical protein FK529_06600 [Tsukamurella asaccharolytica]
MNRISHWIAAILVITVSVLTTGCESRESSSLAPLDDVSAQWGILRQSENVLRSAAGIANPIREPRDMSIVAYSYPGIEMSKTRCSDSRDDVIAIDATWIVEAANPRDTMKRIVEYGQSTGGTAVSSDQEFLTQVRPQTPERSKTTPTVDGYFLRWENSYNYSIKLAPARPALIFTVVSPCYIGAGFEVARIIPHTVDVYGAR